MQSLGNISPDAFVDSCLLAGSDLSPSLPQLDLPAHRKDPKIKSAVNLVLSVGRGTGNGVCLYYQEDVANKMQDYIDVFRKAKLTVKHSVVLTLSGKAEPLDADHAPGAIHEFIGQRLPDELYGYFSRGIIGPRILNWRASSQLLIHPPLDGGESREYRDLVRQKLTNIQMLSVGLLASTLNFYYQRTDMEKRVWFDKERAERLPVREEYDHDKTKKQIESWNVPQFIFGEEFNKHPVSFTRHYFMPKTANTITEHIHVRPLRQDAQGQELRRQNQDQEEPQAPPHLQRRAPRQRHLAHPCPPRLHR
jgi:hypothetical protein